MSSKAMIDAFVSQPALALIGMSRTPGKFGNVAYRELKSKGYRVYPIHPSASAIDGVRCYNDFADLPETVDGALVIVPPESAIDVIRKAAKAGIRRVWLQQGAESPEVLNVGRELELDVISGECILMFARPGGFHKAHRWLWRLLGKLPAWQIEKAYSNTSHGAATPPQPMRLRRNRPAISPSHGGRHEGVRKWSGSE
jgi:predicted CoA-binding protein